MISELLLERSSFAPSQDWEAVKRRYSTEKFYLRPCEVGLGVFANRDIAAGEVILTFSGPLIDFAETKRRGPHECMAIQVGPNRYLDTQPPGVFVNHSCEPNAGIRNDFELVALQPIRKGEEIRFDYSTTMEEQSFTMECLCGAPSCRKLISDFSTLPQPLRVRYVARKMVMSFIREKARWKKTLRPQSQQLTAQRGPGFAQ